MVCLYPTDKHCGMFNFPLIFHFPTVTQMQQWHFTKFLLISGVAVEWLVEEVGKKVFLDLFCVCLFLKDEKRADKMTGLVLIDSFVFNI